MPKENQIPSGGVIKQGGIASLYSAAYKDPCCEGDRLCFGFAGGVKVPGEEVGLAPACPPQEHQPSPASLAPACPLPPACTGREPQPQ